MRPPAQVDEIALLVERDGFILDLFNDFDLEGFPFFAKQFDRVFLRHLKALHGIIFLNNLVRPCLYFFEILRRERPFKGKVVIKAFVNGRADREIGRRKHVFHGLGHNMSAAVPINFLPVIRRKGHGLQRRAPGQGGTQVTGLTVNPHGEHLRRKRPGHLNQRLAGRDPGLKGFRAGSGQGYLDPLALDFFKRN